jgi:hypothetical protein
VIHSDRSRTLMVKRSLNDPPIGRGSREIVEPGTSQGLVLDRYVAWVEKFAQHRSR